MQIHVYMRKEKIENTLCSVSIDRTGSVEVHSKALRPALAEQVSKSSHSQCRK